jgi:hypothetical protein
MLAAYCRIGSLAGTSMLVLVGVMTYTTLVFLLRGSAATGATTYSQLTQQLCGTAVMKVRLQCNFTQSLCGVE